MCIISLNNDMPMAVAVVGPSGGSRGEISGLRLWLQHRTTGKTPVHLLFFPSGTVWAYQMADSFDHDHK